MDRTARLLFTAIAVVMIGLGVMAILSEVHTASTRRAGLVTVVGSDAVWMGKTLVLLGMMPLVAWVPKRFVGLALGLWVTAWAVWLLWWILGR